MNAMPLDFWLVVGLSVLGVGGFVRVLFWVTQMLRK